MFSLTGNTMRYVKRTEVSTEEQFQMIHELVYAHDELVSGGTVRGDLCIADNGDACRAVYANYNAAAAVFADRMLDGLDWYFLAGHLQGFESALFRRSPASIGDWLDGQDEPLAAMAAEQLEQDIVRMQSGQSSTKLPGKHAPDHAPRAMGRPQRGAPEPCARRMDSDPPGGRVAGYRHRPAWPNGPATASGRTDGPGAGRLCRARLVCRQPVARSQAATARMSPSFG